MSRVQLALNVDDIDEAVAFYSKLFGTEPAKAARLRELRHRRAAAEAHPDGEPGQGGSLEPPRHRSSRTPTPSTPSRPGWPRPAWPRSRSGTRPAATPGRTSSGSRAPPTASGGRSTPSWRTARPSGARTASSAGTRSRPSWTPPGRGGHASACGGRSAGEDAAPPCLLQLTGKRAGPGGDKLLLIAYTPPGPAGAYAERGPVFIHAERCGGYLTSDQYPPELAGRQQVVRAYDQQGRIADGVLAADGKQAAVVIAELLARPEVELVHLRNVGYGCYNFSVRATG